MKRSKYVQLSLAASVAMAISGCGPTEKTYDLQKKYNFQSVQQCADEKLPVDVCSDAYMTAMAEHRRIARYTPARPIAMPTLSPAGANWTPMASSFPSWAVSN